MLKFSAMVVSVIPKDIYRIIKKLLITSKIRPILYQCISAYVMPQLLRKNVGERLGSGPDDAKHIKQHLFFRHMNWDDVLHHRVEPPFKPVLVRIIKLHISC